MIAYLSARWRDVRRWVKRSEWAARLLGLSRSEGTAAEPGLVLIQIDGLSKTQLQRALGRRRVPFLRRLIEQERYRLHPLYSGLPASTPAVQAELFYGVKTAVPAFSFLDRATGRVFRMYFHNDAAEVERRLARLGEPLLAGGSAYTDIFTGGAEEPHYCASKTQWRRFLRTINPLILPVLLVLYLDRFLRAVLLFAREFWLALRDCLRGALAGQTLLQEVLFILTRLGACILLRELVLIGVEIDVARGLPIIHANFIGYDEQAHRRGPSSAFAHGALDGIDRSLAAIWDGAHRSSRRNYDVWIYSDHGQEDTVLFSEANGRSVQEAIAQVFSAAGNAAGGASSPLIVTAMGSLGHVYPPSSFEPSGIPAMAQALVDTAKVPLVLTANGAVTAHAWTAAGRFRLPEDAAQVFGADHPYLEEVARDFVDVCRHPDAGTFVICGWRAEEKPLSFPDEHGSHTGPGREETNAFALLPPDAPVRTRQGYLRATDLRFGAQRLLGRPAPAMPQPIASAAPARILRVMTYNVHSCIGLDGKLAVDRIARIIERHDPDVVALQELDVQRLRTGGKHQAQLIAQRLQMAYHFEPSMRLADEQYGDAVMSRYPMRLVRSGRLPGGHYWPDLEPRGALWVALDIRGSRTNLIATHLSLWPRTRLLQAATLLGPEWADHPACHGPVIVCGDFNATPRSAVYQRMQRMLRDAQTAAGTSRSTWTSRYPITRIDHVFVGGGIEVLRVDVAATELERLASDHLPLIVDLRLPHTPFN